MPLEILLLFSVVLLATAAYTIMVAGHDTPNAIALPVRSHALTTRWALFLTAIMRTIGVFIGVNMIEIITTDIAFIIPQGSNGLVVLLIAVSIAFFWGLFTWSRGVPSSSSHALSAGFVGALMALYLTDTITAEHWEDISANTVFLFVAVIASPLAGTLLSWVLMIPALAFFARSSTRSVHVPARMVLAVTGAANGLGHGVQYGMRIAIVLSLAFAAAGVPSLQVFTAAMVISVLMAIGTALGGWKIAHTLTERLVLLDPLRSAVASLSSALLLLIGSFALALPISSTLTTGGAILGAGGIQAYKSVRWPQVSRMSIYFAATVVGCIVVAFTLAAAVSPVLELAR